MIFKIRDLDVLIVSTSDIGRGKNIIFRILAHELAHTVRSIKIQDLVPLDKFINELNTDLLAGEWEDSNDILGIFLKKV